MRDTQICLLGRASLTSTMKNSSMIRGPSTRTATVPHAVHTAEHISAIFSRREKCLVCAFACCITSISTTNLWKRSEKRLTTVLLKASIIITEKYLNTDFKIKKDMGSPISFFGEYNRGGVGSAHTSSCLKTKTLYTGEAIYQHLAELVS